MKKLFMILGTLAVLAVFAGCSNPASNSGKDYGTFTVKEVERVASESQQQWAQEHNCSKNDEGKYVFYQYFLQETSNEDFKKYSNKDIFYSSGNNSVGNMYYAKCKDKIEKMLSEGKVLSDDKKLDWLKNNIVLNSYPQ